MIYLIRFDRYLNMLNRYNDHVVINTMYDYLSKLALNTFGRKIFLEELCIYASLISFGVKTDSLDNVSFIANPRTPRSPLFDLPDEVLLEIPAIKKHFGENPSFPLDKTKVTEVLLEIPAIKKHFGKNPSFPLDKTKVTSDMLVPAAHDLKANDDLSFIIVYNLRTKKTELRLDKKHYFLTLHPAVFHDFLCNKFPIYKKFIEERKKELLEKPGEHRPDGPDGELFPESRHKTS